MGGPACEWEPPTFEHSKKHAPAEITGGRPELEIAQAAVSPCMITVEAVRAGWCRRAVAGCYMPNLVPSDARACRAFLSGSATTWMIRSKIMVDRLSAL